MTPAEEDRELWRRQMEVDIDYKRGLLRWEPWKVVASFVVATAAVVGVTAGLIGYRIGQIPQTPQIVNNYYGVQPVPEAPKP